MCPANGSESNHSALRAKEIVMKILLAVVMLAVLGTALVGCKAEGKVSDTKSNVSVPQ